MNQDAHCSHQTESPSTASTVRPTNHAAHPRHHSKHQPTLHGGKMPESGGASKELWEQLGLGREEQHRTKSSVGIKVHGAEPSFARAQSHFVW